MYSTKFYSAADAVKNMWVGTHLKGHLIVFEFSPISASNTRFTDLFLRVSHDAVVRVTLNDSLGNSKVSNFVERYNIIHIPIPDDTKSISMGSLGDPSLNINESWALREQHSFIAQPSMKGSKVVLDDKLSISQTGLGHNAWSPRRNRLRFNFKNHPEAADSKYIRDLAYSREKVYCWPCGGYSKGRDEDELPEWLAYDNLILIACNKHKFEPYEQSWSQGLTGSAEFYEPIDDLANFTVPVSGRLLCFLDGTPWCTVGGDRIQTV